MIHTYTAYKNDKIADVEPVDSGGEQVQNDYTLMELSCDLLDVTPATDVHLSQRILHYLPQD
jgi:hypothetical protein